MWIYRRANRTMTLVNLQGIALFACDAIVPWVKPGAAWLRSRRRPVRGQWGRSRSRDDGHHETLMTWPYAFTALRCESRTTHSRFCEVWTNVHYKALWSR
ncbi:hypothetical protein ASPTUDRAFT_840613 [Aspergillus tubingensis CBS 134.48]|uniref:Uncharacterized protein n=1 Tax=Aspergillus tubingensis (strain CBS 134.48) TaxID=767770 RepID=A0A1L9MT30_ASPTC|nr:hypothetical protein ASPTUDRAFT_840613 [Aspergillus tubingensis CBS 134.48]